MVRTTRAKRGGCQPKDGRQANPTPANPFGNLPRDKHDSNDDKPDAVPASQLPAATNPASGALPPTSSTSTQTHEHPQENNNENNDSRRFIPAEDDIDPFSFMSDVSVPMPDIAALQISSKPSPPIADTEAASFMQSIQCEMQDAPAYNLRPLARGRAVTCNHNGAARANAPPSARIATVTPPFDERCRRHCTTEVATRLFGEAPNSLHHGNVFSNLDRLVALEEQAVRKWRPQARSLAEIAR
ncbi:uncharacterized protein BDZ99DRAFT_550942 [Mytilinidion resinicola]|uniref:Uncharacterized protein n=1 Tax=Mytilinidion resinicola TaxID=574789 RepID=A0A6A6Y3L4_9PEZI|nr:uncharacterized protein BDZ99DRAFT_550942 [Mytilinidion resinicola]KAF2802614.1 hypothetical protein BDZ99DRAFT_550942 [Mytilinidion resinicola]